MSSIYIFDIECFLNYFSVIFKNVNTKELKEFIIFEEKNDLSVLYDFITDQNKWFIGYNSYNFDNQLLKFIHTKYFDFSLSSTKDITIEIYNLASRIITSEFSDYKYNLPFKYIDLMAVGGYYKSLKLIGVSMKWPKIQDCPILQDNIVTSEDVNIIRKYNLNDVLITEQLYYKLLDRLKLRAEISSLYNIHAYTASDSNMANRILEKFYSEASGLDKKYFKGLRTERKFIKFDWVIFKEINFQTEVLMNLLEEMKNHTYYKDQPFFKKVIVFDGVKYKLGIGGIHSVDSGEQFEETKDVSIIDADITSMYPTLAINHNLAPEHLGTKFMKSFRNLRDKRVLAKKEGRIIESEGLKVVLVSIIGKTLNPHIWLYDPIVNLKVTINGQLYILMLIEQLTLAGFKVISANTDGVVTLVHDESIYKEICDKWCKDTQFDLEYNYYKKYIRRDVNNYVVIKKNDTTKEKGIFNQDQDLLFKSNNQQKGFDKPIISIALYNYFVKGIPVKDTIMNHTDIYDFCIAKKIDKKFTNEYHYLTYGEHRTVILQKSIRYYVAMTGSTLLKTDREHGDIEQYEVNKKVIIFNDFWQSANESTRMLDYKIDYGYYINSAQKIINEIINPQLTLF